MDKDIVQSNILLPKPMWKKAKLKALQQKISLAEFIRRAIDFYLSAQ